MRGGPDGDSAVTDSRTGAPAVLPGPDPSRTGPPPQGLRRDPPRDPGPLVQRLDGSLFYPDTRAFFDGFTGPFVPESGVAPVWNPEFFGNTLMVNGRVWPFHPVDQRRYRLRLLNGCNSRFLILDFSSIPGVLVHQIGNDGGLLAAVHDVMVADSGRVLLGLAERADLIVDFSHVPPGNHAGTTWARTSPTAAANPTSTSRSRTRTRRGRSCSSGSLRPPHPTRARPPSSSPCRPSRRCPRRPGCAASRSSSTCTRSARAVRPRRCSGPWTRDPANGPAGTTHLMWMDPVTENPAPGDTEVWEVYNLTADAHPVHIHEVAFEVVDRQPITVVDGFVDLDPESPRAAALPGETGRKDTVIAYPEQVTRVRATFGTAGQYVWHCHIVEHEDNEMMRPFRVGPAAARPARMTAT